MPPLTEEQEQLILDYMNLYFASLEDFEPEEGIAALFSDGEQAALADSAIDFQIGLRQMQDADYTLASCTFWPEREAFRTLIRIRRSLLNAMEVIISSSWSRWKEAGKSEAI